MAKKYSHTTIIVDLETVTGFNIPYSSNLISSSVSEIISNISFVALNLCLLDISIKDEHQGFLASEMIDFTHRHPTLFLLRYIFFDYHSFQQYH